MFDELEGEVGKGKSVACELRLATVRKSVTTPTNPSSSLFVVQTDCSHGIGENRLITS